MTIALGLSGTGQAQAAVYYPPKGKVFSGVVGGRTTDSFRSLTGRPVAVHQFFIAWGDSFYYAFRRAADGRSRLALHLSTYNGEGTRERITPKEIATGQGDDYLVQLATWLSQSPYPTYVRLFSEMNNAANPYSAFNADGSRRDESHSQYWFRQAWRRSALILRGGRVPDINRRLRSLGLPEITAVPGDVEEAEEIDDSMFLQSIPRPRVALQWVPMTAGSPNIPANMPVQYWPGSEYVDWVGTDFYSRYPNFSGLERFYRQYAVGQRKPFVFGEWALWGADDSAFARRFMRWVRTHKRVRMVFYNQGNQEDGIFRLHRYPRSAAVLRRQLRTKVFTGRAPEHRRAIPAKHIPTPPGQPEPEDLGQDPPGEIPTITYSR